MKTRHFTISALFTCLFLCFVPVGTAEQPRTPPEKTSTVLPPDKSSAALNRIKELEGKWKSTTSMFGKENEEVFTVYKVTAGGSAVVETQFPGTPHEMISVYYDDDEGKLAMTHYCMMRNRPYFTAVETSPDQIKLDVVKVEGLESEEAASMGAITLKFEDENHYSATCESRGKGAEGQAPMTMHFARVSE